MRATLMVSRRDAPLRLIIPTEAENTLAAYGFEFGDPIRSLPYTRAVATPIEIEAAAAAGITGGIALDRIIPRPKPTDIPDWMRTYLVDWADVTGAKVLHARGFTGRGTAVAVIDTGIQGGHPYFRGSNGRSRVVAESCFVNTVYSEPAFPCPGGEGSALGPGSAEIGSRTDFSHGTHVAGIVAGDATQAPGAEGFSGMAPEADLVISRVFGSGGAYDSDIISALDWVADQAITHNIAAVNLSLGHFVARYYACSAVQGSIYGAVTAKLRAARVAIVAAAGNNGSYATIGGPACTPGWVSVGATDWLGRVAWFTNVSEDMDILAPGESLWSAVPGDSFEAYSGTSMATPVVAGAFGLMRQAVSEVSPDALLSAMRATGPRIDDVIIKQMPTLRIDRAYDVLADPSYPSPATNVRVTTTATSATVTWGVASSGERPTSYLVRVGDRYVSTDATSHTFEGLTGSDYSVSVTPRVGDTEGIATEGPVAFAVIPSWAQVVNKVGTGYSADFCPGGDVAATLSYPPPPPHLDSGTKVIRVIAGVLGENTVEYGHSSDTWTYRFDIKDPEIADSPVVEIQRVDGEALSPSQRLSDLTDLIPGGLPAKPRRLTAKASPGSISLAWQAGGSNEWRVLVDGNVAVTTAEPRVTVSTLGGEHEISVCAVGSSGSTSRPQRISVDVPAPLAPPTPPLDVQASPGDRQVTVSWQPPVSDGGLPITDYRVTSSPSGRGCSAVQTLTCVVTGLTNGIAYTFTVTAVNGVGTSEPSAPSEFAIPEFALRPPGMVRDLRAKPVSGTLRISWARPDDLGGAKFVTYEYRVGSRAWKAAAGGVIEVQGRRGVPITVRVRALNDAGPGPVAVVRLVWERGRYAGVAPVAVAVVPKTGSPTVPYAS